MCLLPRRSTPVIRQTNMSAKRKHPDTSSAEEEKSKQPKKHKYIATIEEANHPDARDMPTSFYQCIVWAYSEKEATDKAKKLFLEQYPDKTEPREEEDEQGLDAEPGSHAAKIRAWESDREGRIENIKVQNLVDFILERNDECVPVRRE